MRTRCMLISAVFLAATLMAAGVRAQEKHIQKSELPAAVQKTVEEQSKGATLRGFSTEKENGQIIYEAELTVNGHSKDISMDGSGKILEVEEQVELDSLSAAVREGLQKKAGAGKITKVESLTKNGKLVAYEAAVRTGTKRSEVQVGPDGKPLARKE